MSQCDVQTLTGRTVDRGQVLIDGRLVGSQIAHRPGDGGLDEMNPAGRVIRRDVPDGFRRDFDLAVVEGVFAGAVSRRAVGPKMGESKHLGVFAGTGEGVKAVGHTRRTIRYRDSGRGLQTVL